MPTREWNGVDRRHGPDDLAKWRAGVDARLDDGGRAIAEVQAGLATNTMLTASVDLRTQKIEAQLAPMAEAWGALQTGLRVLGWIGKAGTFALKNWLWFVGAFVFAKVVILGGGLDAAITAFWKSVAAGSDK
jgi:hypothetical protein